MNQRLWRAVGDHFDERDVGGAVAMLEKKLRALEPSRFGALLDADFTNKPADVLAAMNKFLGACDQQFRTAAVYLEMNGFDINPGRWYFDLFGYDRYEPAEPDWICDWKNDRSRDVTLKGLEAVQKDFDWYHSKKIYDDKAFDQNVYELAVLLVMAKFVRLVETALASGTLARKIPVLATAHEFDIIGRFEPPVVTARKPTVRRRK